MILEPVSYWLFPLVAGLALIVVATALLRIVRGARGPGSRTLILGTGPLARELIAEIDSGPDDSYRVVGAVAERSGAAGSLPKVAVLGTLDDLQDIISRLEPDRIIVALNERRQQLPVHQLVEARIARHIVVEDGESVYERLTGKLAIESLKPSNVIFSGDFRPAAPSLILARGMSVLAAVTGLIALAPLMALIVALIKLDSRGPVLFVQERAGLGRTRFNLLKFRTMHPQEQRRSEWVRDNNDRITRVGKWLRKFRLDELPQFINILRGDMNLVGPRPHPASNVNLFTLVSRNTPECGEQIPYYSLRSMVRPGITGWAQVRYQYANDLNEEIEKLRYDLYYIKHFSIDLDLRILLDTVKIVLLGREGDVSGDSDGAAAADDEPAAPLGEHPAAGSAGAARVVAPMAREADAPGRVAAPGVSGSPWPAVKQAGRF